MWYELPCFAVLQFMLVFRCVHGETLDCAQQLQHKVCGTSNGHYPFFISGYVLIYKMLLYS